MQRKWSKVLLRMLRVKAVAHGVERNDPSVTYIVVANHASYLDIPVLVSTLPIDLAFVFKEELTKVPFWGWSLLFSPHIKIHRSDPRNAIAAIEEAAGEIRSGRASVVIFPEGTRSVDGTLGEFKRGGFMLATRTGVPILPVAIRGSHLLIPRTDWRVRPGTVEIFVGEPIDIDSGITRERERAVQAETRRQLEEML
jgi:1-acyl-sn-glycerol-3-phosphate acyltransferase